MRKFRIPHSVFRIPYSVFRIPYSVFRIRKNPLKTTKDKFIQNSIFYFYIMLS